MQQSLSSLMQANTSGDAMSICGTSALASAQMPPPRPPCAIQLVPVGPLARCVTVFNAVARVGEAVRIGRSADSGIQILHANVSMSHCVVQRTPHGTVLEDTSMNGTHVNHECVVRASRPIQIGDEIAIQLSHQRTPAACRTLFLMFCGLPAAAEWVRLSVREQQQPNSSVMDVDESAGEDAAAPALPFSSFVGTVRDR